MLLRVITEVQQKKGENIQKGGEIQNETKLKKVEAAIT